MTKLLQGVPPSQGAGSPSELIAGGLHLNQAVIASEPGFRQ